MLYQDGIISREEWEMLLPSEERRKKGAYVLVECFQDIPCNPCMKACRFGAVQKEKITDLPKISHENCTGCTACVHACPGQACFVIDETWSERMFLLTLPYEMLPAPEEGNRAALLDRAGNEVGTGKIIKVRESEKTWVVTVEVPKEYLYDVRNIRPES